MRRLLPILLLVLSGCTIGNDCAMKSFELGQRDGVLGANQAGRYAACPSFDGARYAEGFSDALSRRPAPQGD